MNSHFADWLLALFGLSVFGCTIIFCHISSSGSCIDFCCPSLVMYCFDGLFMRQGLAEKKNRKDQDQTDGYQQDKTPVYKFFVAAYDPVVNE